ncbi:hypothetical protein Sango_2102200 [Sesamum angolense]|uniref:Transposase n=1 Tax=Sesamum angolense TaxID=2727404 RepID=A0AAE1WBY0_9LAMI|nr:hypothetical protein Sango_2102200 [Sesamum angolense]
MCTWNTLIEELLQLWHVGVRTYDHATDRAFIIGGALIWTVNDLPAYGMASGWSTVGLWDVRSVLGKLKQLQPSLYKIEAVIFSFYFMSRTNSQDCGDRILKKKQLKASSKVSRSKEVSPSSSGGSVNINRNENFGVDDDDMDCDLDCVPEDDVCGGEQDDIKPRKRKDRKEIASRSVYWDHFDKILNFCPISGHKSEEVGLGVEKCLLDWGIDKVFTVTVDNASSNDGAILYLPKKFDNWGTNILGGKYVHMRCIAHIVNLIVQDGLRNKEEHLAISRIGGAIRWNSTYLMLEATTCLKRAFSRYEDLDFGYTNDLSKPHMMEFR